MVEEDCPNCKEKISVHDNAVVKKIGGETMKFCSLACADAYKEVGKTHAELAKEKLQSYRNWGLESPEIGN